MAIHLTTLRTLPEAAVRCSHASLSGRAAGDVRQPESALRTSFRSLATAASADQAPVAAPAAAATQPTAVAAPTPEAAFGPDPWVVAPTGLAPDGTVYNYNSQYFATPQTAAAVAQLLGGTVVQAKEMTSAPGSTFQQQEPNEMVRLPTGALINPGLVAGFYTHGYPQSVVDQMIANEVANVNANT